MSTAAPTNNNPVKYNYSDRITVTDFYKADNKTFHDNIRDIFDAVGKIAIDRLEREKFEEFYNKKGGDEFLGADFTFIKENATDPRDKAVGFLFASYHIRKKTDDRYEMIGKAFPAIQVEERGKPDIYDRTVLYGKFMEFYVNTVSTVNPMLKKGSKEPQPVKDFISKVNENAKRIAGDAIDGGFIEIYVENPGTFSDLHKWGFKFNIDDSNIDQTRLAQAEKLGPGDLLKASYEFWIQRKTDKNLKPPYLVDNITYAVNITPEDWRRYFTYTHKEKYFKFYLLENFNFPNSAFLARIPVDSENIGKAGEYITNLKKATRPSPPPATPPPPDGHS